MTVACPTCGSQKLGVISTRPKEQGILRRRECEECHARFTTVEMMSVARKAGRARKFTALRHLYQDLTAAMKMLDVPPMPLEEDDK